jgi:hypothetical protein
MGLTSNIKSVFFFHSLLIEEQEKEIFATVKIMELIINE